MSTTLQQPFSPLFAHGRPVVRPDEVCAALGCKRQQVADLATQGQLQAFGIGDAADRVREHLRFTRSSVEGFFAFRLELRGEPLLFDLSPEAARWRDHLKATARNRPAVQTNPNPQQ